MASKKILIVDDEAHIRLLLEQTLEDLDDQDLEVMEAKDGEEALEIILREKPKLVFLDVMIPKLNGFDLCDAVKNKNKLRDVYIVMITAKGQEQDRQAGYRSGADAYITKPFNPDELLALAEKVICG